MKKLLVLSGKGGTGKTTVAAALIKLAKVKAMADCDVDAPNLHLVNNFQGVGVEKEFIGSEKAFIDETKCAGCGLCARSCRFGAIRVIEGKYTVDEYRCEGCGVCLYLCPHEAVELKKDVAGKQILFEGEGVFSTAELKMGRGNSGKLVNAVKSDLFKKAADHELTIVDGSPGIGCPVISLVSGMDMVLIVAEPSVSGVSDLMRLVRTAETFQTKIAVCVNKWDVSPEQTEIIEKFCTENSIPFVGRIPYDKAAGAAINAGKSIVECDCIARDALVELYKNVKKIL